jgi:hypothetical protein
LELWQLFSGTGITRRIAGIFYESYCRNHMMTKGIKLELWKMVRKDATGSCFQSSHKAFGDEELDKKRGKIMGQTETVTITDGDLRVKYYDNCGIERLDDKILYIPETPNANTLDAFFKCGHHLYILQFTIAERHDIKDGLKFLSGYTGCPRESNWKFVFVIDGSKTLKVPAHTTSCGFDLYSAIMTDEKNPLRQ